MLSTPRFVASAVLGLALVTACGSTTDSTASSNVDIQAYASAQCDYFVRCQPAVISSAFGTKDACTTAVTASLTPELTLKGVSLSESQAKACAAKEAAQACDDATTPAECQIKGTLANDTACAIDLQCASGNCYFATSDVGTTTTCGTCKAFVAAGASCADGVCAPGLNCNAAGTCVQGAAEGAACSDDIDCGGNLQCAAGKCAKLFVEGTACPVDEKTGRCDSSQNLYCKPTVDNKTVGTCAKYAFADLGQPCGLDRTTYQITNCTASQCIATADISGTTGTCTARLAAGAACSPTSAGCTFGLACTGGVCTAPDNASCNP